MVTDTIGTAVTRVTDTDTTAENKEDAEPHLLGLQQRPLICSCKPPRFAAASHTANLDIHQNLRDKGAALMMPDIPELKHTTLPELHQANYADHVGSHRSIQSVQRPAGLACTQPYVSVCEAARYASKTSTRKGSRQAGLYPCLSLKLHGTASQLTASLHC